jgi:hypothetical protein
MLHETRGFFRTCALLNLSFLALAVTACQDEPMPLAPVEPRMTVLGQVGPDGRLEPFPELVEEVGPVAIVRPTTPPAYESGSAALVDAVRDAGGQVFIAFKPADAQRTRDTGIVPGISREEALRHRSAVEDLGVSIVQTYRTMAAVVAVIDPEMAPQLEALPFVDYVEPVGVSQVMDTPPADALPSAVAALPFHEYPVEDTSWGVWQIRAPTAWAASQGLSAAITILDTGMDYDHMAATGGDALYGVSDCLYASPPFTSCFAPTDDNHYHGSAVYGVATGRDNAVGWIGVAYGAYQVASVHVCDEITGCPESAIAAGLEWVAGNGRPRQIVNMSFARSAPYSTTVATAIGNAYNAGVLLIAAAGNTPDFSAVTYPAAYSQVMAVSGTLEGDAFASSYYCVRSILQSTTGGSVTGNEVEIGQVPIRV